MGKSNKLLTAAAAVCLLSLVIMAAALTLGRKTALAPAFTPPAFAENAVTGTPEAPGDSWTRVYQEGMPFSAHVCGRVKPEGETAQVYFTNDAGNTHWLKLRILDEDGNLLAETGLLRPGEYVRQVTFTQVPKEGTLIRMKIMAYEPDTYQSAGAVTLKTVVG